MLDNYNSTVRALTQFLIANAPAGAEREIARLQSTLDADEVPNYISLEFRPVQDVQASLYVSLGKWGGKRIEDEEGNVWYQYELTCEVSWPTWGSSDVATCQRRLALMTEVTRFAADVQSRFNEPVLHLSQTKAKREEQARHFATQAARKRVETLMRNNIKGLRVGQERRVEPAHGEPDFLPVGRVEYSAAGRTYTTEVTATRAFYFTRTA